MSVSNMQGDAEFARPLLQDQEQRAARAAAEAVAADPVHRAAEVHGDIVPIGEFLGDAAIARRIVFFEIVERGVGKHHAEAEGVVGAVALIDRDLGLRPLLFEQDRGIETGRSSADDRDLHGKPPALLSDHLIILNLKHLVGKPSSPIRSPHGAKRNPGFPEVPAKLRASLLSARATFIVTSIALKHRLHLVRERLECTGKIRRRHAQRLRDRLGLDRLLHRHRPFHRQHTLGHGVGEGRPLGNLLGEQLGLRQHLLRRARCG